MAAIAEWTDSPVVVEEAAGAATPNEQSYPTLLQSRGLRVTLAAEGYKAVQSAREEAELPAAGEPWHQGFHDVNAIPEVPAERDAEPKVEQETVASSLGEETVGKCEHEEWQIDEEDTRDEHPQVEIAEHEEAEAEETENPEEEAEHLARAEAARQRAADDEFFWTAARMALSERERREKVGAFLKAHRFSGVNTKRGWFFSYDYPLHCAARHSDVEIVRLLLTSKAAPKQRDSDGLTARQVAKRENYLGSHSAVIKALRGSRHAKRMASIPATGKEVDSITGLSKKKQGEAAVPNARRSSEASGALA